MKLYVFVSKNITNIWAGIGAGKWAVSDADPTVMQGRRTRALGVRAGQFGIIYCSQAGKKSLTTPFIISSRIRVDESIAEIWPEIWRMPFDIHPLGSPRKMWRARDAARELPFAQALSTRNLSKIFKPIGTAVFSPIEIGDADWEMIMLRLSNLATE
jgi:hypothetical protein